MHARARSKDIPDAFERSHRKSRFLRHFLLSRIKPNYHFRVFLSLSPPTLWFDLRMNKYISVVSLDVERVIYHLLLVHSVCKFLLWPRTIPQIPLHSPFLYIYFWPLWIPNLLGPLHCCCPGGYKNESAVVRIDNDRMDGLPWTLLRFVGSQSDNIYFNFSPLQEDDILQCTHTSRNGQSQKKNRRPHHTR